MARTGAIGGRAAVELRAKLNLLIGALFLALTVGLSVRQVQWVNAIVVDRATARLGHHIRGAWRLLDARKEQLRIVAAFLAREAERGGAAGIGDAAERAALRRDWGLDVLGRAGDGAAACPVADWLAARYPAPGQGDSHIGFAAVPAAVLEAADPALAARARVGPTGDGLLLFAWAAAESGPPVAVGALLNNDAAFVTAVRDDLFGEARLNGAPVGTATLFLGDVRVATTVLGPDGAPALGTRVSGEVARQVLEGDASWLGPADVVGRRYLSRYDPIRDPDGQVVGMLYIGELEAVFDAIKRRAVLSHLAVLFAVMLPAFALGLWLSNRLLRQVVRLERATHAFAAGDYSVRAPATSENEIGRLARAFNVMAAQIEKDRDELLAGREAVAEANRNYIDLLSFVTHDLRSRLAAALLNTDLLKNGDYGPLGPEQAEGVGAVEETLRGLNDVTLNYLQLARIEEGHRMLDRKALDLRRDVIEPVLRGLEGLVARAGMRVEQNVPEGLVVAGDRNLLRIVYQNLLQNAVKFGRRGGRIALEGRPEDGRAVLSVFNEGEGIASAYLPEVFRKFRRFDVGAAEGRAGTGVGLYVARQIVEQHGGHIEVESVPGESARFRFTLLR